MRFNYIFIYLIIYYYTLNTLIYFMKYKFIFKMLIILYLRDKCNNNGEIVSGKVFP